MRTKSIRTKKSCCLALEELETRLALSLPRPDHVVLVMMENHNYNEIIGVSSAPYINNTLAAQGALMTNSFAIEHPSEPNYLDIFSGSNQGVTDDTFPPPGAPYKTPDLGGELIKAGFTFGGYSEDMPSVGYTGDGPYGYAGKHNPMVDFADVPAADNMPFAGYFPSDFTKLPTLSFVVPNLVNDMHDGTVSQGDTWLKNNIEPYRQWAQTHNSLLIVTWDEDDSGNNQIATIFDGQMVKPGQYSESLNHFGVLRTIEDMYSLPYAGASATATPVTDIFVQGNHLKVTSPASATAGSSFSITVTAQDANNNTLTSYLGTIHFTSSDGAAVLPSNYTFTTADAGVHTFTGIILKTANIQSITATDTITSSITGSGSVTVNPAAAKTLAVSGFPTSTTAGTPQNFNVTARDAYGNTATGYAGTVAFSSSDAKAVLPANYKFNSTDAGKHTFSTTLNTIGTQSITATDTVTGSITGTESGIVVTAAGTGATYYVSLTGSDNNPGTLSQPFATINHGASVLKPGDTLYIRAGTYAEELVDAIPGGTSWNAPVAVAAYPGETVILRPTRSTAEGILYFAASSEQYILVKGLTIDATYASADAVKITYSAGASSHIRLQSDEIENTPNGMGVLVSGDPASGNNVDYNEFINCKVHNNGSNDLEHGFYITTNHNLIDGCDIYSNAGYGIQLYAGDGHNSLLDQSNIVRNNRVHDNNTSTGSAGAIVVATGDNNLVYNNLVYNNTRSKTGGIQLYAGCNATSVWNNTIYNNGDYGIENQSTNSTIQNNIIYGNASGGINNQGSGATIDHNTSNSQNPLFVNPGAYDFHLQAGSPAIDAGITLTQVPVDLDGVARPQGNAYDIGAFEFVANSGVATSFLVTGYTSPTTAGTAHTFNVTVKDANGNTVTGYTGTVTFSSTDTKAILPANYTFTSADAGVHTFSATLKVTGTQSLTAKDTVTTSIMGSQTGITVNPAAANHLVVSRFPSKTTAGANQSFRVTAQDQYGNTATTYTGTVTFSSSDVQAILPANYTFTATDAGVHTFSGTLKSSGNQSLTGKDTVNTGVASSTQSGITVNPAATSLLQVTGFPVSIIAGTAANFTVTAIDSYGNTTPAYVGTVKSSSSDSQAVLPANYTFTGNDAGVHTFSATLKTVGAQSISSTDVTTSSITGSQTGISVVTVRPTATISGPSSGVPGQPLTFTLGASESGLPAGTVYSYSVQWGDGSPAQTFSGPSGTQATHGFLTTGVTTITLTATDPKGNLSSPVSASVTPSTVLTEPDPSNSSLTALYIGGTIGDDTIAITPVAGNGIKVGMNGVNYGSFFPSGHVIIYGQAGNDIIKTAAQTINGVLTYVNVPVMFFGGVGNDILNATGSIANNVLVGGTGAERLLGGQGRDILIGGSGTSTLNGGSGGDILIGGTTNYDNNAAALAAILAEWSRTDIDYSTRVAHLLGTSNGGLNGSYLLNTSTVHADGLANNLYGGAGADWFFAGVLDLLFNQTTGEVVTNI